MRRNRDQEILHLLMEKPFIKIDELCQELNVSPATIRRDLSKLEQMGAIIRINGGAILSSQTTEKSTDQAENNIPYLNEKQRIARAAAAMIEEGQTIFLDAGSTNQQIANEIASLTNITIVTNSIEIAYKFVNRKDLSVIICGGTLGEVNPTSIVGALAEKMISMFRANICFIGTSGINIKQGITDPYLTAAAIKEKMIENANQVVLVTDHSKFGVINTVYVCPLSSIDHIITDHAAPREDIEFLVQSGMTVTLV